MSDNSRGSLSLSGAVRPSRWGALHRADASCCFDSSEWLGHHSLSLFYIYLYPTIWTSSQHVALKVKEIARDQRSWLWLYGARPQLRIGMTAGWETVRSQESRWGTRARGLERGPIYFLFLSSPAHMESALKVFQQNWNAKLYTTPPSLHLEFHYYNLMTVSLLKHHWDFLSSLVLLNTDS